MRKAFLAAQCHNTQASICGGIQRDLNCSCRIYWEKETPKKTMCCESSLSFGVNYLQKNILREPCWDELWLETRTNAEQYEEILKEKKRFRPSFVEKVQCNATCLGQSRSNLCNEAPGHIVSCCNCRPHSLIVKPWFALKKGVVVRYRGCRKGIGPGELEGAVPFSFKIDLYSL